MVDGITLDAAAGTLGVTPTHLVRAFGAEYGIAPHRYLTGRRLDRARRLLLAGMQRRGRGSGRWGSTTRRT